MKVLLRHRHGLGDTMQATIVVKHLKKYRPDWRVTYESTGGKYTCLNGIADHTMMYGTANLGAYDKVFRLDWHNPNESYANVPSTKPTKCLKEVFDIVPDESLYTYEIKIPNEKKELARRYVSTLPKSKGFVLIHYQGASSTNMKNLAENDIQTVATYLLENNYTPVILDWDFRSMIVDQKTIFCPDRNNPLWCKEGGDGPTIAALCEKAALFIGIDSGPAHVAAATQVPGIVVWTGHHPVNFFDLSHFVHLVNDYYPKRRIVGRLTRDLGHEYFERKYRHRYYSNMVETLCEVAREKLKLTKNPMARADLLTSRSYGEQYYREHKNAGLDYLACGDWQYRYADWLCESLNLKGKVLLDVGCACGSITSSFKQSGVRSYGCDVNEHCINLGRKKWPDLHLNICDAINMHFYEDGQFDVIHLMQTAEHFRPDHVPLILREFARVGKPGCLLFSVHDTLELFERQGRLEERGDPTHACIKPREWWHKQLTENGWVDCSQDYAKSLSDHPNSYFKKYDWDWLLYRKEGS